MSAVVLRADALSLPLADASVDLICTSPPYFALRSYQDNGAHYENQIGSENTPAEFVDALIGATREMVRVLKPTGSIWVNLGDKYAQSTERSRNGEGTRVQPQNVTSSYLGGTVQLPSRDNGVRPKSLIGIPWRYALRCIDELGLILRAEVIWSKPNGLPESVTDRVRRSHEQWFHFTRSPRYFSAVDEIRGEHTASTRPNFDGRHGLTPKASNASAALAQDADRCGNNPLGKLPGSVWTIPTQPLTVPAHLGVDHFAAFPMEFPRRIILGWSPSGVCTACGEGRRPVVHTPLAADYVKPKTASPAAAARGVSNPTSQLMLSGSALMRFRRENPAQMLGYACACTPYTDHPGSGESSGPSYAASVADGKYPGTGAGWMPNNSSRIDARPKVGPWREYHAWEAAPTRPAVVLDPFSGTGTVPLVADVLGRRGIGIDLSSDYCRLARWRTTDPGQRAQAAQVEKPPPVIEGQEVLFGDLPPPKVRGNAGSSLVGMPHTTCAQCGYRSQNGRSAACEKCGVTV